MRMDYQVDDDEKLVRDEVWIAIRDFFEEFGRVPSVIIANLDNEYIGAQEGIHFTHDPDMPMNEMILEVPEDGQDDN